MEACLVTFSVLFGKRKKKHRVVASVVIDPSHLSEASSTPRCTIAWPEGRRPRLLRILQRNLATPVTEVDEAAPDAEDAEAVEAAGTPGFVGAPDTPYGFGAEFSVEAGLHVVTFYPDVDDLDKMTGAEEKVRALLALALPKRVTHSRWRFHDAKDQTVEDIRFTVNAARDPARIVIAWPDAPIADDEGFIEDLVQALSPQGLRWDGSTVKFQRKKRRVTLRLTDEGAEELASTLKRIATIYVANLPTK